jgi:hypothetical protein
MEILSTRTVEITNQDLELPSHGQLYARLKPSTIERLAPIQKAADTVHLAIARVRDGTKPFQLPDECVLLAIEGNATVSALGQSCAIWFCENLSLEADIAVLGVGHLRKLNCETVSLLPMEELRNSLPNVLPQQISIEQGRINNLFLAHYDARFPPATSYPIRAEIRGLRTISDLCIGTIDSAIVRRGKMLVQKEVYLEEWLREEIHELLWKGAQGERTQLIDQLLQNQDRVQRYSPGTAFEQNLKLRRRRPNGPESKR